MSQASASMSPSAASTTVSSSGSRRRPVTTILAPQDASSSAVARPMPLPPPVTIATWPSSRFEANWLTTGSIPGTRRGAARTLGRPGIRLVLIDDEGGRPMTATTIETAEGYASGGAPPALIARNLYKAFQATVERLGDEVAVRDPERGVELTWSALRGRVAAAAGGLARLGVGKGDTVALLHSNRHEFYVVDLAAAALGAVPFSIYPTY